MSDPWKLPLTLEQQKALKAENQRNLEMFRWHMNGSNGWRKLLFGQILEQKQSGQNFYC